MVVIQDPTQYRLKGFEVRQDGKHKYNALLEHRQTHRIRKVPFGGIKSDGTPYQHYHDRIGHFRDYDHNDRERRRRYRVRHRGEDLRKYSSGYFSMLYLW